MRHASRWRFPRFLRLTFLLLLLLFRTTAGVLYKSQSTEPLPACLLYHESAGEGYFPKQANPRSGQTRPADQGYATTFDFPPLSDDFSSSGQAFTSFARSNYAGPDALFVGVPGSEKLRLVANEYSISYGWSPDGNALAYFYDSHPAYVAITDPGGRHKRVQALDTGTLNFAGWSADGKYLAAMTFPDQNARPPVSTYYFIATDTLQLLSTPISALSWDDFTTPDLVWAPRGHRFAYIDVTAQRYDLVIATPEQGLEQRFDLHTLDEGTVQLPLVWSPDGRYVTARRRTGEYKLWDNGKGPLWEYWMYNIFGVDGTVHSGIAGQKLRSNVTGLPDGWWSADGSSWIFRQHFYVRSAGETKEEMLSFITAYSIKDRASRVIASNVAASPLLLTGGTWLAVPVWSEDKTHVGLVSIDGKTWATLVTGADSYSQPRLAWSATSNQGTIAAIWTRTIGTQPPITSLTWAHADGSGRHTLDRNFDDISELHWLDDHRSLLFIARRGELFTVGIVDLESGAVLIQMEGLTQDAVVRPTEYWREAQRIFSSPSGRRVVLKLGQPKSASLYLIALDTKRVQRLRHQAYDIHNVRWAPDESAFAFIQEDRARRIDTLQVVTADGVDSRQIDLQTGNNALGGWTWCQ